jgi:hypothetical protein
VCRVGCTKAQPRPVRRLLCVGADATACCCCSLLLCDCSCHDLPPQLGGKDCLVLLELVVCPYAPAPAARAPAPAPGACNKWTLTVLIGNDQQCRCPLETPVHKTMLHSSKHLPEVGEGVCAMAAFSSTPPLCGGSLQALDCQHLSILLTVSFVAYYRQSAYRTCRCISKLHPSHSRNTHS